MCGRSQILVELLTKCCVDVGAGPSVLCTAVVAVLSQCWFSIVLESLLKAAAASEGLHSAQGYASAWELHRLHPRPVQSLNMLSDLLFVACHNV